MMKRVALAVYTILNTATARPTKHLRGRKSVAYEDAILSPPGNVCPSGYSKISDKRDCKNLGNRNSASLGWGGTENDNSWPSGCYHCSNVDECADGTWFNRHSTGKANAGARPWCLKSTSGGSAPPAPPALPAAMPGKLMFAGDSDIEMWKTGPAFPGSSNVGVGGWTCRNVLKRIDDHLKKHSPEMVVLVCGENDLMGGASVDATIQRFKEVVAKINAFGARVVYMGTKPEPDTKELHAEYRQYDAKIRALAAASASASTLAAASNRPLLAMVDVYQGFEAVGNSNSLYQKDKLHLSPKGYVLWTTWAKKALYPDAGAVLGCFVWLSERCVASTSGGGGGGGGSISGGDSSTVKPTAGDGDDNSTCKYVKMQNGKCSSGADVVDDADACLDAARNLGLSASKIFRKFTNGKRPPGCYWHKNKLWFNKHSTGKPSNGKGRKIICEVCP